MTKTNRFFVSYCKGVLTDLENREISHETAEVEILDYFNEIEKTEIDETTKVILNLASWVTDSPEGQSSEPGYIERVRLGRSYFFDIGIRTENFESTDLARYNKEYPAYNYYR